MCHANATCSLCLMFLGQTNAVSPLSSAANSVLWSWPSFHSICKLHWTRVILLIKKGHCRHCAVNWVQTKSSSCDFLKPMPTLFQSCGELRKWPITNKFGYHQSAAVAQCHSLCTREGATSLMTPCDETWESGSEQQTQLSCWNSACKQSTLGISGTAVRRLALAPPMSSWHDFTASFWKLSDVYPRP